MQYFADFTVLGRSGRDVEVKTVNGRQVATLSIAVNNRWTSNGESRERTDWYEVDVWGPLAEIAGRLVKKGSLVHVSGELREARTNSEEGSPRRVGAKLVVSGPRARLIVLPTAWRKGEQPTEADDRTSTSTSATDEEVPF